MKDPRFTEFVELFNHKKFFEAHEVLEDLWLVSHGETKTFYKGLIQLAVAFAHLQRNNRRGARQVHLRATGLLSQFAPFYSQIDVQKLIEQSAPFFGHPEPRDVSTRTPLIEI
jgi:predicted metal-dependent hydrolase